jgi:hypothetical protein
MTETMQFIASIALILTLILAIARAVRQPESTASGPGDYIAPGNSSKGDRTAVILRKAGSVTRKVKLEMDQEDRAIQDRYGAKR